MYSVNRTTILSVFFTVLMVTSLMVVPFTAGAASLPTLGSSNHSVTTDSASTVTPQVEEPDTNKIHVKKNLEDIQANMTVDESPYDADSPRSDEAWVDVYVNIEGEPNGVGETGPYYPFRHTADVQLTVEDSEGEVLQESTDFRMVPSGEEPYSATAKFNIRLSQQSNTTYDFNTTVQTQGGIDQFDTEYDANAHPQVELTESVTVTGVSEDTRSQSSLDIQTDEVFRELSSIAYMNSYKATTDPNEVSTMEDLSLPGSSLSGTVENFRGGAEQSSVDRGYTTFRSEAGSMDIITGTMPIEQNDPQTLIIQYLNTGTSPVNVDLINGSGTSVDPDTSYTLQTELTDETEKYTFDGDLYNIATIRLSDQEQEFINNRGEAFVRYSSQDTSSIQVFCQSFVAGSLAFSDKACGLNSEQEDIETGLITDMTLTGPSGDTISYDEQKEFLVDPNQEVDVDFTVKNTGNSQLNESAYLFTNIGSDSADAIESEQERFLEGVDYNESNDDYYKSQDLTVNFENEHNPDYVTLNVNGSSNQGNIIFEVSNGEKTESRSFPNIDNSDQINLGETFGFTNVSDTYTISVESDTRPFEGLSPQINSFQLVAEDPSVNTDFSPQNVSIPSGETQTISYNDINVGSTGKELLFKSMFMSDSKEISINVASTFDQARINADAGGPYEVRLPIDRIYQEQIGTQTIKAAEKPAPTSEWERVSDNPVRENSTATQQKRVEIERVPQTVNPVASEEEIQDAINKWEREGFMQDLEAYFPDGTNLEEWDPVRVEYQNKTDERIKTARKTEMQNIFGANFLENNWEKTQEVGTETIGYETTWQTTLDGESTRETAQWNPVTRNQPQSVWERNEKYQSDQYLTSSTTERVSSIESGSTPLQCGEGVTISEGYCNSVNSSSYWIRSDEPTRVVEAKSDTQYVTQCTEINPGSAWTLTETQDCDSQTDDKYERLVSGVQELYQWNEYKDNTYYLFYKPNTATINEYVQDMYKTSIIFEKETSGDIYEYRGPVYDSRPVYDPVDLELDASGSVGAGEIEEYSWSFGEVTEDPKTKLRISEAENQTVNLTVTDSAGRTDTDETQINVLSGCSSGVCSWENGIQDLNLNTSDLVNYEEGQANAEVTIEAQNLTKEWVVKLTPSEAQNLRIDPTSTQCPDGYTSASDPSEVPEGYTFEGESGIVNCFYTGDAVLPEDAPKKFAHPTDPDSDTSAADLEYTTGNPDASVEIWRGDSISNRSVITEQINPRLNRSISPGEQEFEIIAEPVDGSRGNVSASDVTQFCLPNESAGGVPPCGGGGPPDDGDDGDDDGGPGNMKPDANFTWTPNEPDVDEEITFESTSTDPDGSIEEYDWSYQVKGVNSGDAEGDSFEYAYENANTWEVTLTVTDDDGATDSKTKYVQVIGDAPSPDIDIDPNPAEVGEEIEFSASGSEPPKNGSIESYQWSYQENQAGDIEEGTGVTETATYENDGEYLVTLTVTGDNGVSATTTRTAKVKKEEIEPPGGVQAVPDVPLTRLEGDPVEFDGSKSQATGPDNEIESYEWTYENEEGETVTESTETFTYTFDESDTYNYSLTVTDSYGETDTATGEVDIEEPPEDPPKDPPPIDLRIVPIPDKTVNVGQEVTLLALTNSIVNIDSYTWSIDGETAGSGESIDKTWNSTDSHEVEVEVRTSTDRTETTDTTITVIDNIGCPTCGGGGGGGGDNDRDRRIIADLNQIEPGCPDPDDLGPNETLPEECLNQPENKIVYGAASEAGKHSWLIRSSNLLETYRGYSDEDQAEARYSYQTLVYDYNLGRFSSPDNDNSYYHFPLDDNNSGEYYARGPGGQDFESDDKKLILEGDATSESNSITGSGVSTTDGNYLRVSEGLKEDYLDPSNPGLIKFRSNPEDETAGDITGVDKNQAAPLVSLSKDTSLPASIYGGESTNLLQVSKFLNVDDNGNTKNYSYGFSKSMPRIDGIGTGCSESPGSTGYIDCGISGIYTPVLYGEDQLTDQPIKSPDNLDDENDIANFKAQSWRNHYLANSSAVERDKDGVICFVGNCSIYDAIGEQQDLNKSFAHTIDYPGKDTENISYGLGKESTIDFNELQVGGGYTTSGYFDFDLGSTLGTGGERVTYNGVVDDIIIATGEEGTSDLYNRSRLGEMGKSKHIAKQIKFSPEFRGDPDIWKEGISVQTRADLSTVSGLDNEEIKVELMPVSTTDAGDGLATPDGTNNIGEWSNPGSKEIGDSNDSTWIGTFTRSTSEDINPSSDTLLELKEGSKDGLDLSESEFENIDAFALKVNVKPDLQKMNSASAYEGVQINSITVVPKEISGDLGDTGGIPQLDLINDLSYPLETSSVLTGTIERGEPGNTRYRDGKYSVKVESTVIKDSGTEVELDTQESTNVIEGEEAVNPESLSQSENISQYVISPTSFDNLSGGERVDIRVEAYVQTDIEDDNFVYAELPSDTHTFSGVTLQSKPVTQKNLQTTLIEDSFSGTNISIDGPDVELGGRQDHSYTLSTTSGGDLNLSGDIIVDYKYDLDNLLGDDSSLEANIFHGDPDNPAETVNESNLSGSEVEISISEPEAVSRIEFNITNVKNPTNEGGSVDVSQK